ncbi:MAG: multiheme c-type cytochrome [Planctomycetia bacterium]|nr:multiheme c-type cytochrome [Planctomycetia bacterium]
MSNDNRYMSFVGVLATLLCACSYGIGGYAFAQDAPNAPRFVAPQIGGITPQNSEPNASNVNNVQEDAPLVETLVPANKQTAVDEPNDVKLEENAVDEQETSTANVDVTLNPTGEEGGLDAPYDVYKENGHYFVDWEKPDVAIVFTGLTNGYIEPCGCAGMDRMKGGLSRRQTFIRQLREEMGWDAILIDSGQITVGFGVQEELKFDMAMNAFRIMGYDAIGIGKGELKFPAFFMLTFTAPTSATTQSMYTSANIGVYGFHPTYTLPYKIIERGGKRVAVVAVVCTDDAVERRDENYFYDAPEKKIREILPAIEKENCDASVLIVHGTEQEALKLAEQFPQFNYVLPSDVSSEPPAEPRIVGKDQKWVEVGEKGKFAVVFGLYKDGSTKYQRVALDSRYDSSPEITLLMKDYQGVLKNIVVSKGYRDGLGVNPAKSPNSEILGKYVGSQKCYSCHEEAFRVWSKSKHATAWKSLKETANPPRDFDPECISCHVVGWDGLQHFPYVDGFSTEEKSPHLANVGCESCHGPGEMHMKAEVADNERLQERIRSAMRLGNDVKKICFSCHDGDNSPEFDFDKYYPLIEHSEEFDDEDGE